ncbi:DUF378 domain-containing protein [Candidatus Woesearchaeota archaeon]|nr:DUF378 domain-containing protein [Candidatus Woesearchaeota archaeon]
MAAKDTIGLIVNILLIIGGLNWGLVGLFNLNVVAYLGDILARIIYVIVGVAALYKIYAYMMTKK